MLSYPVELQPLFRREGIDQRFKTGLEASEMLLLEAHRKDPHSEEFLEVRCHNHLLH
jgi:hypothetical protein